MIFYESDELEALSTTHLDKLHDFQRLHVNYDNTQNGVVVKNANVVLWGRM